MKLVDLQPQWIVRGAERVGFLFVCPHCVGKVPRTHLTCFRVAPASIAGDDDGQYALIAPLIPEEELHEVVPCRRGAQWQWTGETFETLSVKPSLDASSSGHWHGFVTNGRVT